MTREKTNLNGIYKSRVNTSKGLSYKVIKKLKTVCWVIALEDGIETKTLYKGVRYSVLV